MKVEQLLVQYLYKNKSVSIQDIGRFTISPEFIIPAEAEKDNSLPDGAIQFEYDKNAKADDGLIDYIVEQSRKIKPLASSDLESYTILTRQFLNIGKPLVIEGLGVLQKNQQGSYDFTQGSHINTRTEIQPATVIKEKTQEDISFSSPAKKNPSKKGFMIFLLLLFLVAAGASVYYLLNRKKEIPASQQPIVSDNTAPINDSINTAVIDSLKKDSLLVQNKPAGDGYTFKIVIKEYTTKNAAEKALSRLSSYGHKLILSTNDSVKYKLSMPFTSPVSDTLRAKDSIRKFFNGNPYVDL